MRTATLLMLGTVPKAAAANNHQHSLSVIAMGCINGKEDEQGTRRFLRLVRNLLQTHELELPSRYKFMLDGAMGFRHAVPEWLSDQGAAARFNDVVVGMCYFHVTQGVRQKVNMIPQSRSCVS